MERLGHRQRNRPQHIDVESQIDTGGFQTPMTKQVTDGLDADAATKQAHGEGMAQRIGRRCIEWETTLRGPIFEDVDDSVMLQGFDRAADAQEERRQVAIRSSELQVATEKVQGRAGQWQDER